jgi:hypothetical protein
LVTRWSGAGVFGTVITGFLESGDGGLGVVAVEVGVVGVVGVVAGTEASVAPPDGACWTPGADELPQAARATAHVAAAVRAIARLGMKRERVANAA